ncbi:bifunctional diaminohydroxyphosphoribosylaminopyrimidine deaminase/5-amino-6-(5-phosphoribosylamino)uracil reductase RibD [Cognatiyoonia sp. IB215446]|uniref:bifunctional diaminohydroxyphosphoribosylaminopyrimidine deaminase/5-amino-6-(5-phosphoribosylamino)uracil reductase RibD n=1 Tax=Cognatiyoonia sp. IB215446 TaxID=3097355 RepID=UPI002A100ADA|nr:bifunctional diaminohydroxyphosphoribosylaminopyrimidine deaminase/5-amino-6-(5-phosphoribosylamino)uracil reductase RibD [Cognatiyoonia sp. IB215446]MDX8347709.1 bifunctional diaminohydroxyphosphoribosylaminopyrimidine deaminase/5-amino-6-(5-phosphoribosylamino)uracil reductase RibD [Cognatiyoonia sp. IB215446]
MTGTSDERFMALALMLGRRGMGRVWPNPAVGCVIVKDGRIIARAHTAVGGRPHAEAIALAQAGEQAAGATVYVTLEPCAHYGKTPPCTLALINAKVARVVIAIGDPDPRVSGRGIAMLEEAGIEVMQNVLAEEARRDHAGFLLRLQEGRPFVTLKLAGTLDGRIATATGESQWITGPEARRAVHMMRARHDAVMVGAGTVRADNPSLTARGLGVSHQPVRVVVSRALKIPVDSNLAESAGDVPVWLCHGPEAQVDAWVAKGARSLPCNVSAGQVDPHAMMQGLGKAGLTRVFCEGGGMLAASLLHAGQVDELVVFSAGMAIGAEGTPALAAMGIDRLQNAPRFVLQDVQRIGPDICHIWRREGETT